MMNSDLVEQVLQKMGFSHRPGIDFDGLSAVYGRWCRQVPFDNIQKRLFYAGAGTGPVPGHDSTDFFQKWLTYGTGGTCWANSHATHDLLAALGFDVVRCAGTMLSSPDAVGPTHGTVIATLDNRRYLVDGSMLTEKPVPVPMSVEDRVTLEPGHPAERIRVEYRESCWHVFWHSAHRPDGIWCRIERIDVPIADFNQYHERTRTFSRFNSSLYVRLNQPSNTTTIAFGERVVIGSDRHLSRTTLSDEGRTQSLVEDFGIAEELAARLPADEMPAP